MNSMNVGLGDPTGVNLQQVDPTYQAARIALRPLDHGINGVLLGHYRASLITGTTVSITAGQILASLRWAASNYLVLMRIKACVAVSSAITAATVADLAAYIFRGSTGNASGGTAVSLSNNNQKNRVTMNPSSVADLRVATTGALTAAGGKTNDGVPFGSACFQVLQSVTATGTATAGAVGSASDKKDLYVLDAAGVQHPIVLAPNEGIEIQEVTAGPTTGGLKWYMDLEWAEVAVY